MVKLQSTLRYSSISDFICFVVSAALTSNELRGGFLISGSKSICKDEENEEY